MTISKKTTRMEWVAALLVFVVLAGLGLSFVHERISYFSDSKVYLQSAESLAVGKGYAYGGNPEVTWPPVYSAVLAGLMRVGIDSVSSTKILNVLLGLVALLFWWRCLRYLTDRWSALLVVCATGMFFPWVYYSQAILSEMLLSMFVALFFLFAHRFVDEDKPANLVWMTVGAMMAPVTKMAGLAFLVGWGYVVFGRDFRAVRMVAGKRWRAWLVSVLAGIAVVAPLGLWCIRNWLLTGSPTGYDLGVTPEYLYSIEKIGITEPTLFWRVWVSIRGYAHILLLPDQTGIDRIGTLPLVVNVACVGISCAVIVGWFRAMLNRTARTGAVFFGLFGGLLILNAWYDIRYLLPVMPLYVLYLADALGAMGGGVMHGLSRWVPFLKSLADGQWIRRLVVVGLATVFLAFSVASPQSRRLRAREYRGELQRMYEACQFMKDSPETGNVLVAGGPGFVPIWSARPVISLLGRLDDVHALISTDVPDGVRFVLLDESKFAPYREKYMEPVVAANQERLEVVFEKGDTLVYRVRGDVECGE